MEEEEEEEKVAGLDFAAVPMEESFVAVVAEVVVGIVVDVVASTGKGILFLLGRSCAF